jgi:hypothetical protein
LLLLVSVLFPASCACTASPHKQAPEPKTHQHDHAYQKLSVVLPMQLNSWSACSTAVLAAVACSRCPA